MSEPGRPNDHGPNGRIDAGLTQADRKALPLRRIRKAQVRQFSDLTPRNVQLGYVPNGRGPHRGEAGDHPLRERLADRLVKLARLRREEEEARVRRAAAPAYTISDAIPLDRLGFMGLMLRPPPQVMPESPMTVPASIPSARQAAGPQAGLLSPNDTSRPAPDIASLMAEYNARAANRTVLPNHVTAPVRPIRAPVLVPQDPVPAGPPMPVAPAAAAPGPLDADVLSGLDPIKRMAAALQSTAAPDLPAASSVAPIRPAPLPRAETIVQAPVAVAPAAVRPAPLLADRPTSTRVSAWPSFATGFAMALAFGAGLYIFLAGA